MWEYKGKKYKWIESVLNEMPYKEVRYILRDVVVDMYKGEKSLADALLDGDQITYRDAFDVLERIGEEDPKEAIEMFLGHHDVKYVE